MAHNAFCPTKFISGVTVKLTMAPKQFIESALLTLARKKRGGKPLEHRLWAIKALLNHHHLRQIIESLETHTHEKVIAVKDATIVASQVASQLLQMAVQNRPNLWKAIESRNKTAKNFEDLLGSDPLPPAYLGHFVEGTTRKTPDIFSERGKCRIEVKD